MGLGNHNKLYYMKIKPIFRDFAIVMYIKQSVADQCSNVPKVIVVGIISNMIQSEAGTVVF